MNPPPAPAFAIEPLTHARARELLPRLLDLDRDTAGERWEAAHWLADLPAKWELSRVAAGPGGICGFVVASRKPATVHIHRVAVAADSRGRGIAARLIAAVASAAERAGDGGLSLKVDPGNTAAAALYDALGFTVSASAPHQIVMEAPPRVVLERAAARHARPAAQ